MSRRVSMKDSGLMSSAAPAQLSREHSAAFVYEATSAQNLLRDGLAALRGMRFAITGGDSVFTQCAIGVEKLMKLTLGLHSLNTTGAWLTKSDMTTLGHKLVPMDVK